MIHISVVKYLTCVTDIVSIGCYSSVQLFDEYFWNFLLCAVPDSFTNKHIPRAVARNYHRGERCTSGDHFRPQAGPKQTLVGGEGGGRQLTISSRIMINYDYDQYHNVYVSIYIVFWKYTFICNTVLHPNLVKTREKDVITITMFECLMCSNVRCGIWEIYILFLSCTFK